MLPSRDFRSIWLKQVRQAQEFLSLLHRQLIFYHSHPIHPVTVHFPLTLFTLANVLNLVYGMVLYFPDNPFLSHDQQNLGTLSILGYAANVLGIITSIPAVVTGGAEFYAMVQGNGFYETKENGQKQLIPKVKTAFIHVSVLFSPSTE
jgi:uncharacterized membrane protein